MHVLVWSFLRVKLEMEIAYAAIHRITIILILDYTVISYSQSEKPSANIRERTQVNRTVSCLHIIQKLRATRQRYYLTLVKFSDRLGQVSTNHIRQWVHQTLANFHRDSTRRGEVRRGFAALERRHRLPRSPAGKSLTVNASRVRKNDVEK